MLLSLFGFGVCETLDRKGWTVNQCGGLLDVAEVADPEKAIWLAADLLTWAQDALEGVVIFKRGSLHIQVPHNRRNMIHQKKKRNPVVSLVLFSYLQHYVKRPIHKEKEKEKERKNKRVEMDALWGQRRNRPFLPAAKAATTTKQSFARLVRRRLIMPLFWLCPGVSFFLCTLCLSHLRMS